MHLAFLRRCLPYAHGVPGERWLTILMNRFNPALFSEALTAWVRETFPGHAGLVAIDGKTSRRSHHKSEGKAAIHLVSAFATTSRLVLYQEAVPGKANDLTAIPKLLERLGADGGLKGALVSINAIATNAAISAAIRAEGADYLLAAKASQPTLCAEVEAAFAQAVTLDVDVAHDRNPGRIGSGASASCVRSKRPAAVEPTRAASSPRPASPPDRPPRPCADTGPSKAGCTGFLTSSSATASLACARD